MKKNDFEASTGSFRLVMITPMIAQHAIKALIFLNK